MLKEFANGLCTSYIAFLKEEFGMAGEELPPARGCLFEPGEEVFGGKVGAADDEFVSCLLQYLLPYSLWTQGALGYVTAKLHAFE